MRWEKSLCSGCSTAKKWGMSNVQVPGAVRKFKARKFESSGKGKQSTFSPKGHGNNPRIGANTGFFDEFGRPEGGRTKDQALMTKEGPRRKSQLTKSKANEC